MIISPLIKFSLYCLFIILSVNYLGKNSLDNNTKYLIMVVCIIPYLWIDTLTNHTNINQSDNESFSVSIPTEQKKQIKQPEIILSKQEEITNKNVEEEIKITELNKKKKEEQKIEHFNSSSDNISEDQIRKIIDIIKKEKLIEKMDNSPSDNSQMSITSLSSNPDYQPLGENGNNFTNKWDQDYLLLNTEKWAPTMKPTPVCKAEKECPVCPSLTTGYPISLKEFDSSRKITTPVNADLNQINK